MTVTNMRIMIRRDTEAMWLANGDNVLLEGEIGYELDSRKMKIGYQSKSYSELPYFAAGIVSVDGSLTVSDEGVLSVDNDFVLGELPADTNMKAYVDGLVQAEGSVRAQEDQLLSDRIDALKVEVGEDIGDIAEGTTVKEYVDQLIQNEASVRANVDNVHNQQLNNRYTKAEVDDLISTNTGGIAEGTSVKEYVDQLIQNEASVRANLDTIHTSQLNNRYTKAETYSKTEVDTALAGKADLTGANFTGPVSATEFQGTLNGNVVNAGGNSVLLDNTAGTFTGNTFGVSTGQHFGPVFKADTQASPVVVLNPGTGATAVATYEGDLYKQGGMVKMVDSVAGTFNGAISGDVTGNLTGNT